MRTISRLSAARQSGVAARAGRAERIRSPARSRDSRRCSRAGSRLWDRTDEPYLARASRVVIGADLTRASLRLGAAAARRFGLDRVLFVETDLNRPGLRRGAFDVVYSSGVLHHTPDPRASFARMARLARPGGM